MDPLKMNGAIVTLIAQKSLGPGINAGHTLSRPSGTVGVFSIFLYESASSASNDKGSC